MPVTRAERKNCEKEEKSLMIVMIGAEKGGAYLLAVPGVFGDGVEGDWEGFLLSPFRVMVIRYFTPEWNWVSNVYGNRKYIPP